MSDEQKGPEPAPDPFALWRQWYEQQQQAWGKGLADTTGSEAFAEMQGKMLETFLAFQKTMRDTSRAQLEALGLATRDDVARLGEIVLGLEEKIDELTDLFRPSVGGTPPSGPRGRGPWARSDARPRRFGPASAPRSARPGDGGSRRSTAKKRR